MYKLTKSLNKKFILKEQAAIDAINSRYSYNQVKFFFCVVPDLLKEHEPQNLASEEVEGIGRFIGIMLRLIDSTELSAILNRFAQQPNLRIGRPKRSKIKVDTQERSEIMSDDILAWLSVSSKNIQIKGLLAIDDYFTSLLFFKAFTLWVIQSNFKSSSSIIDILDSYYAWFPIVPFIKA